MSQPVVAYDSDIMEQPQVVDDPLEDPDTLPPDPIGVPANGNAADRVNSSNPNGVGPKSWSYQDTEESEIYSLRHAKFYGQEVLVGVGTDADPLSGKRSCGFTFVDPAGGEVMETYLHGDYNDKPGWDEVCTDAAGPDTGGIAVVGYSEHLVYNAQALRSVVPFLKFHGWNAGATDDNVGFDLTVDLKEHLRLTVEADHYQKTYEFYTAMSEIWQMTPGSKGVKPVPPTRKKWSHYPVRMIPVPSDLSVMDSDGELPVADLIVLLSSSASAQPDDRESPLNAFVEDGMDPNGYGPPKKNGYRPPSNFAFGDVDKTAGFDGAGRGLSVLRLQIFRNATDTREEVLWHTYQHANGPQAHPAAGATVWPTDLALQRCHKRDQRCREGWLFVGGSTGGTGEWFFGVGDRTSHSPVEGFVTRLRLDTGDFQGAPLAHRVGSSELRFDNTVGGLCATDPDENGPGSLYVVGSTAGAFDGATTDTEDQVNVFVASLNTVTMTLKNEIFGDAGENWGELSKWHSEHDKFGGSCVATSKGVHIIGTVRTTQGPNSDPSRGMKDVFVVSLNKDLDPLRKNDSSLIIGTPADDTAHGLIHGGGGLAVDPTDSSRLIIAGNSMGSLYSYPQARDGDTAAGFWHQPRSFLATIDVDTGAYDETLPAKCVRKEPTSTRFTAALCRAHELEEALGAGTLPTRPPVTATSPPTSTKFPTFRTNAITARPTSDSEAPTYYTEAPTYFPTEFPTYFPTEDPPTYDPTYEPTAMRRMTTELPTVTQTPPPTYIPTFFPTAMRRRASPAPVHKMPHLSRPPTTPGVVKLHPAFPPTAPPTYQPDFSADGTRFDGTFGAATAQTDEGGGAGATALWLLVGIVVAAGMAFAAQHWRSRREHSRHQQLIETYAPGDPKDAAFNLTSDLEVTEELDFDEAKQFTIT